jgi:hypothetical protein
MENNHLIEERKEKLALATLMETDGGKVLAKALLTDIKRYVELLSTSYRTESHTSMIQLCADLNAALSLYQALTRAEGHVKELDQAIEEAITLT